jgi:hypothetical protein
MAALIAVLLSALNLLLLWVASSVFRGKGLVVVVLGVLALWLALSEYRRGRRTFLYRLCVFAAICAAAVLACEGLLRLFPGLPGGQLANYVSHGYHGEPDGIYVRDPLLAQAMRPSFRRAMYWNGHVWTHETNADGYRGPRLSKADAVVLGGAAVYGHGVETDQTVPARLAAASGLSTANLGQQGACLVQDLELLRRTGLRLKPRLILVCSQAGEVADALHWYAPEELEHFLSEDGYRPLARPAYRETPATGVFTYWFLHVALPLHSGRLVHALIAQPQDSVLDTPVRKSTGDRFLPAADVVHAAFAADAPDATPEQRLGWQANRRALAEIQREAAKVGARVIVFDLGYPAAFSAALQRTAQELGVTYCDAGPKVLGRAQAGEDMYLARDGHWAPKGCDAVARELAKAAAR